MRMKGGRNITCGRLQRQSGEDVGGDECDEACRVDVTPNEQRKGCRMFSSHNFCSPMHTNPKLGICEAFLALTLLMIAPSSPNSDDGTLLKLYLYALSGGCAEPGTRYW
jgi:hypothetical protein